MQSSTFIENKVNQLGNAEARESRCASILFRNGVIYSYGSHYPLLFIVRGYYIVNASGYSSSTGKHISWAFRAVPRKRTIAVKIYGFKDSSFLSTELEQATIAAIKKELAEVTEELKTLSPRAFRQKENLETRKAELIEAKIALKIK